MGAFTGTAVAKTVGENIVSHTSIPQWVILGVLVSGHFMELDFAIPSQFLILCIDRYTVAEEWWRQLDVTEVVRTYYAHDERIDIVRLLDAMMQWEL